MTLGKIVLLNLPFLVFKHYSVIPSLVVATIMMAISSFSLYHYKELNTMYFPNWIYLLFFILANLSYLTLFHQVFLVRNALIEDTSINVANYRE